MARRDSCLASPMTANCCHRSCPAGPYRRRCPRGRPPLKPDQVDLIRRWIAEGATDDTPDAAEIAVDRDHPPVYTAPPVLTSLDYSPDGTLLAVSGYHEVLLHKADGTGARRPPGGLVRADRVGPLFPRRQTVGRDRRLARPLRRSADLGCRERRAETIGCWSLMTRFTVRAGRPTARRLPSAAPITPVAPSKPRLASRSSFKARTVIGCSIPSSRSMARTWSASAAIAR